jgi:hypothetical protein
MKNDKGWFLYRDDQFQLILIRAVDVVAIRFRDWPPEAVVIRLAEEHNDRILRNWHDRKDVDNLLKLLEITGLE